MADTEYEELRRIYDRSSHAIRSPAPFYSLVPNVDIADETSPTSSSSPDGGDEAPPTPAHLGHHHVHHQQPHYHATQQQQQQQQRASSGEDDEDEGGGPAPPSAAHHASPASNLSGVWGTGNGGGGERRRRKLPEIPKNKRSSVMSLCGHPASLAEELGALAGPLTRPGCQGRPLLVLKCGYLLDEDSSPDSDRLHSLGDVDSGHSTAHSPADTGPKSISPTPMQIMHAGSLSPSSSCSASGMRFPSGGGVSFSQLEMLEATHRGLHKFISRHRDEIDLEIGDPLYVQKEADDLWCEGVNLRTGQQGIFPSAYAVDIDYNDFDPANVQVKRERYLLGYLGSVETLAHKGTGVVCQAVKKIVGDPGSDPRSQPCILEVSDQGLRMVDRSKPGRRDNAPCIDYFYSLKNVSFCAFHPRDHRYLGFITKHPTLQRFACHVFRGQDSTRPVAEAVGRAFQRFYQKFIETAYPIEDIYIE